MLCAVACGGALAGGRTRVARDAFVVVIVIYCSFSERLARVAASPAPGLSRDVRGVDLAIQLLPRCSPAIGSSLGALLDTECVFTEEVHSEGSEPSSDDELGAHRKATGAALRVSGNRTQAAHVTPSPETMGPARKRNRGLAKLVVSKEGETAREGVLLKLWKVGSFCWSLSI